MKDGVKRLISLGLSVIMASCTVFSTATTAPAVEFANTSFSDTEIKDGEELIAYAELGKEVKSSGMKVWMGDVNNPQTEFMDGRYAWVLKPSAGVASRYIYVDIDDDIMYNKENGENIRVIVDYYNHSNSSLTLEYPFYEQKNTVSTPQLYGPKFDEVKLKELDYCDFTGSDTWQTHEWLLQRPSMENSLSKGDFRFGVYSTSLGYSTGDAVYVSRVRVIRCNTKSQLKLDIDSDRLGNIYYTDEDMNYKVTIDNSLMPARAKENGEYKLKIRYTLKEEKTGKVIDVKEEEKNIKPMQKLEASVKFKTDRYDLYIMQVEVYNEEKGVYSTYKEKTSYVRSSKGKIVNEKMGVSYAQDMPTSNNDIAEIVKYGGFSLVRPFHSVDYIAKSAFDKTNATEISAPKPWLTVARMFRDEGLEMISYTGLNPAGAVLIEKDGAKYIYSEEGRENAVKLELGVLADYGETMDYWDINNEVALKTPYGDDYHAKTEALLDNAVLKAIQAEFPHLQVNMGGQQTTAYSPGAWFNDFFKVADKSLSNVMTAHTYTWEGSPMEHGIWMVRNGSEVDTAKEIQKEAKENGFTPENGKELWITEFGYSSYYQACLDERLQAAWNIQSAMDLVRNNFAQRTVAFKLDNGLKGRSGSRESNFGLLNQPTLWESTSNYFPDPSSAKPSYLAYSNYNLLMYDADWKEYIRVNSRTAIEKFYRTKEKKDMFSLYSISNSDPVTIDLGANQVDVYDMYGNMNTVHSDNGVYTFTASEEPIYIEGSFKKFEITKEKLGVRSDTDSIRPIAGELNIPIKNLAPGEYEYSLATRSEDFEGSFTVDESGVGYVKGKVSPTKLTYYDAVRLEIKKDGKTVYASRLGLDYTALASFSQYMSMDESGAWKLNVNIKNNSDAELAMKFTTVEEEYSDKLCVDNITLMPRESKDILVDIPEDLVAKESFAVTLKLDMGENGVVYNGTTLSFNSIKYAEDVKIDGDLSEWSDVQWVHLDKSSQYTGVLGYAGVYGGAADISGKFALKWNNDNLYIAATVTDDVFHCKEMTIGNLWQLDSIQAGIVLDSLQSGTGNQFDEFGWGMFEGKPTTYRYKITNSEVAAAGDQSDKFNVSITQKGTETTYELEVPWSSMYAGEVVLNEFDKVKFNFVIADNDGTGKKGTYELTPGIVDTKNYKLFRDFVLVR